MRSQRPALVCTLALLVGALLLAGCSNPLGGDDTPPQVAAADRSGRELTPVETRTALPPEASLPEGWVKAPRNLLRPGDSDRIREPRCRSLTHGIDAGWLDANARSYASYVSRGGAVLGVGIGSHPDEAPALDQVRSTLRACHAFVSVTKEGQAVQVQAQPLKLPYVAEDALAYRMVMRSQGQVIVWDLVRVRVGHNSVQGDLLTLKGRPRTKPMVTAVKNALLNLS